jgi:site-specific DNA-methyltransferase (adenine-specific)
MENIILKNGDALTYLRELPDNSIDLAILDPPWSYDSYGQFPNRNIEYKTVSDAYLEEVFREIMRILKPKSHCYLFTTNLRLGKDIPLMEKIGFSYHQILIVPYQGIKLGYGYRHEFLPILFLSKNGSSVTNYHNISNLFRPYSFNTLGKPLPVIETLVKQSSKEGDTVIDPFMGTGTTAVACKNLKRNFIGFEIDTERYKEVEIRISSRIANFEEEV